VPTPGRMGEGDAQRQWSVSKRGGEATKKKDLKENSKKKEPLRKATLPRVEEKVKARCKKDEPAQGGRRGKREGLGIRGETSKKSGATKNCNGDCSSLGQGPRGERFLGDVAAALRKAWGVHRNQIKSLVRKKQGERGKKHQAFAKMALCGRGVRAGFGEG